MNQIVEECSYIISAIDSFDVANADKSEVAELLSNIKSSAYGIKREIEEGL